MISLPLTQVTCPESSLDEGFSRQLYTRVHRIILVLAIGQKQVKCICFPPWLTLVYLVWLRFASPLLLPVFYLLFVSSYWTVSSVYLPWTSLFQKTLEKKSWTVLENVGGTLVGPFLNGSVLTPQSVWIMNSVFNGTIPRKQNLHLRDFSAAFLARICFSFSTFSKNPPLLCVVGFSLVTLNGLLLCGVSWLYTWP